MKKLSQALVLSIAVMLLAAPQLASALEIEVLPNGWVNFYQGSVLGKDSDEGEERDEEDEEDQEDEEDEKDEERKEEENRYRKVIKAVGPAERKEINVRTRDDKVEVEVRGRDAAGRTESRFERKDEIETDEFRLRFPARDDSDDKGRDEDDSVNDRLKSYRQKLLEERKERNQELVELRKRFEKGEDEIELKSRDALARFSAGADFTLDPVTNQVTVTSPSGEEYTLYHLPDQAVLRMQEAGLLSSTDDENEEEIEVEIETTEDDGLVYKLKELERKRLFGLFGRDVPKEIELDDDTGEIIERTPEDRTPLQRFFDGLSF